MDSSKPDSSGEFETTEVLRESYSFCPDHMITDAECRTVKGRELPDERDMHATCDVHGLKCKNYGMYD